MQKQGEQVSVAWLRLELFQLFGHAMHKTNMTGMQILGTLCACQRLLATSTTGCSSQFVVHKISNVAAAGKDNHQKRVSNVQIDCMFLSRYLKSVANCGDHKSEQR